MRIISALKKQSLTPFEIAERSGLSIDAIAALVKEHLKITDPDITAEELFALLKEKLQKYAVQGPPKRIPRKVQFCWDCVHAVPDETHGCSWSNFLKPVEGWQAEKTDISYHVISCPLFEKDPA